MKKTFFRSIPKPLKIAIHFLELLLGLYVTTIVMMINTPFGPYLTKYVPLVGIIYMIFYPPLHLIVELMAGVPGTSPDEAKKAKKDAIDPEHS